MPGPLDQPSSAALGPPLDLAADVATVQLLRVVRQLLVDAEHRAAASDPLSRMTSVLTVGTAIETLLRAVYERICADPRHDVTVQHVEGEVGKALAARGLRTPGRANALRHSRQGVAHHGAIPSGEDTRRHVAEARVFATDVVRATWAVDLECLTAVALVQDEFLRLLLVWAHALLDDPGFEFEDTDGHRWPGRHADRRALAVGFAGEVVRVTTARVIWPRLHKAQDRFRSREDDRKTERLVDFLRGREDALRCDLLGFVLGVRQTDVARFLAVPALSPGFDAVGALHPTGTGGTPTDADARFTVDFATDWVLRAQPHVGAPAQRHPLVEYTETLTKRASAGRGPGGGAA